MEKERCDNYLYEYACDWSRAGKELRCEEWKPESDEWELENDDSDPNKVMHQYVKDYDKQKFVKHLMVFGGMNQRN